MPERFYITTPIYYVNARPHIGHAYTTLLADVLSRYYRLLGIPTHFLTGTDEHGQKVAEAAKDANMTPKEQADSTVLRFQELFEKLEITNDDFIRTTEVRHTSVVSEVLQELYERGEIYSDTYAGWYSVYEEQFFMEKDLLDGKDPLGGRPVEWIEEKAYFFRMSKYQSWLIEFLEHNPGFIKPDFRRNETLGFLKRPLEDLCISRPKARMAWGIELPFDPDYVCYVWFDALLNYITAAGYRRDDLRFGAWWPANCHLIGKDILITHTVYWPTMLRAMRLPLPDSIVAHGWWLVNEEKMSKTRSNAMDPNVLIERYGVDAFRYFLMAEMTLGQDANFSELALAERFNADLAGDLGNMLSRTLKLTHDAFGGKLPEFAELQPEDIQLRDQAVAAVDEVERAIQALRPDQWVRSATALAARCNPYFEKTTPWKLARDGSGASRERLGTVLRSTLEVLRVASGLLYPVIPRSMAEYRRTLGVGAEHVAPKLAGLRQWPALETGAPVGEQKAIFPRIDIKLLKSELGDKSQP